MLTAKLTEHLLGITLEGEFQDFDEIVDSIHRMTALEEDMNSMYYGVEHRLLGICYDIRHASMGHRDIIFADNGVHDDMMRGHSMVMPKQNVHFSVNIYLSEAVFVALAIPEMMIMSYRYYGERAKIHCQEGEKAVTDHGQYIRDKAILELLSATILKVLGDIIGGNELEKLLRFQSDRWTTHFDFYLTQYVDKCNIEYIKTEPEKRKDKIRNIAKRLVKKPAAYYKMQREMKQVAVENGCSIYDVYDPRIDDQYPQIPEW